MKAFLWFGSALLALASLAHAQNPDTTALLLTLPQCAQTCLVTGILNSTCGATDTTCVCNNAPLQDQITACVSVNCTLKQGLFTKNVTETVCGAPIRDRTSSLITTDIVLGIISGVLVLTRIVFKLWSGLGIAGDDWWIMLSIAVGIPSTVIIPQGTVANGLGKDVWTVPFDSITRFGMWFYVMELLYFVQLSVAKMSLIFFFLRIFPSPPVRKALWATAAFNGIYCLVFVLIGAFQCHPIDFYWTKWDNEHQGTCLDLNAIVWSNAAISIALDAWMLAIPLSQLRGLNLHWKKKVGVGMMFCVGTFVTVVSILRLQSLVTFAFSQNPTWDQYGVTLWSNTEINVGIICTCMPTFRLMLVRIFPSISGTSRNGYFSNASNMGRSAAGGPRSRIPEDAEHGTGPSSSPLGSIHYQKSYSVRYDESETDQQSLVQLHDLELKKSMGPRFGEAR